MDLILKYILFTTTVDFIISSFCCHNLPCVCFCTLGSSPTSCNGLPQTSLFLCLFRSYIFGIFQSYYLHHHSISFCVYFFQIFYLIFLHFLPYFSYLSVSSFPVLSFSFSHPQMMKTMIQKLKDNRINNFLR